jgi:hypothetical protein
MNNAMIMQSTITCPACDFAAEETMASDSCQFFYECRGCGALLRPLPGDCCVFCSYGSVPCPPFQEAGARPKPAAACGDRTTVICTNR